MEVKNIGQTITSRLVIKDLGTIVINGVPQFSRQPVIQLVCPNCGAVLYELTDPSGLKQFYTYEEMGMFCGNCGQKLILERGEVIENGK